MHSSSQRVWRIALSAGLLATVLLAAGFVYSLKDILYPVSGAASGTTHTGPTAAASQGAAGLSDGKAVRIVALGDSLTKGYGDTTGKGYVGDVRDLLAAALHKPVYITGNYGVVGYRSNQLLNDLNREKGVADSLRQADVVLFTIGGNDLSLLAENQSASDVPDLNFNLIERQLPQAENRLKQIFQRLEQINSKAAIVYVSLYNPFLDIDTTRQSSVVIMRYNEKAFELANPYPNIVVVPTYDLFERHMASYLYTDHFHPNQTGYMAIAKRILEVLQ